MTWVSTRCSRYVCIRGVSGVDLRCPKVLRFYSGTPYFRRSWPSKPIRHLFASCSSTTAQQHTPVPLAMPKRKQEERSASCPRHPAAPPAAPAIASGLPRGVLPDFNSLDKLLDLLRTCKRIVVVTGAGIRQETQLFVDHTWCSIDCGNCSQLLMNARN